VVGGSAGELVAIPATPVAPRIGIGTLRSMEVDDGGVGANVQQFLVTWIGGASGTPRALASELRTQSRGAAPMWEVSPAISLSTGSTGVPTGVVAVGLQIAPGMSSGDAPPAPNLFVAAWSDDTGDIRASVFGAGKAVFGQPPRRVFANPACEVDEFVLPRASEGVQEDIAVAAVDDFTFVAAWTDRGGHGADTSGAGVRLALWRAAEVVPL
jgi:hypothetical protein